MLSKVDKVRPFVVPLPPGWCRSLPPGTTSRFRLTDCWEGKSFKIKRRWSTSLESRDSPNEAATSTSNTSPSSAKLLPMSIVPGSVTANLAPYVSLPVVANSQIIPNMAYMGGSSAAMPYMFHHQTTQMSTSQGTTTNGNSAVNLIGMTGLLSQKDSRWLQLEVCREFQRNKCSRCDTECKFAHPASNVEVQSGRVTACYDSIKGRCNRDKPACKYFHPPQHLKDQLLINGRNHLALKNAIMQQMGYIQQPIIHPPVSTMATPYVNSTLPQLSVYSSQAMIPPTYIPPSQMVHIMAQSQEQAAAAAAAVVAGQQASSGPQQQTSVSARASAVHLIQTNANQAQQNSVGQNTFRQRTDKLEVCREFQRGTCNRSDNECRFAHPADSVTVADDGSVTVCMDFEKGRCTRDPCRYFHRPEHLRSGSAGVPVTSPNSSPGTVTVQSQQQLHLNHNHTHNHVQQQQQQQQQQQSQQQSQQNQVMQTSALCNVTTSMADVQASLHNTTPTNVMTIPTNVGHYKTPTIGLLDKQSNLPVYQPVTLAASEPLTHAHTLGANPGTVQAHHPSVYHPAMIHPLQQPHQAPTQQTFLGPSCELMPVPAYYNNVQYY